jgi:Pyruvate/2-oxoacid:ferredoxin oxidoreductase delta subunit
MYQVEIEKCSGCETCVDVCLDEATSMVDGHAFID